jgi:hypothetical protein
VPARRALQITEVSAAGEMIATRAVAVVAAAAAVGAATSQSHRERLAAVMVDPRRSWCQTQAHLAALVPPLALAAVVVVVVVVVARLV